jgi:hypothetical protein
MCEEDSVFKPTKENMNALRVCNFLCFCTQMCSA